ncbi:MAG: methionine biosynthesis protein MetW [Rhodospirillaceae bacterium]
MYGAPDLSDNPDQGQAATSAGPKTAKPLRDDLKLIADLVAPKSRVLDVGCDTGDLLYHLIRSKQVDGRGIELSMEGVRAGVAKGVAVIQGDADTDLFDYPDNAFDYVLLSQTLQATRQPREVLDNLTRIGRRAIVSLPNFGHWRSRLSFLLRGRMPETSTIPHHWWDTPNIHLCTVKDFLYLCEDMGLKVERALTLDEASRPSRRAADSLLSNLLGAQAVFVISRPDGTDG